MYKIIKRSQMEHAKYIIDTTIKLLYVKYCGKFIGVRRILLQGI